MTLEEVNALPAVDLWRIVATRMGWERHRWGGTWGCWRLGGQNILLAGSPAAERQTRRPNMRLVAATGEWAESVVEHMIERLPAGRRAPYLANLRFVLGKGLETGRWAPADVWDALSASPYLKLKALVLTLENP